MKKCLAVAPSFNFPFSLTISLEIGGPASAAGESTDCLPIEHCLCVLPLNKCFVDGSIPWQQNALHDDCGSLDSCRLWSLYMRSACGGGKQDVVGLHSTIVPTYWFGFFFSSVQLVESILTFIKSIIKLPAAPVHGIRRCTGELEYRRAKDKKRGDQQGRERGVHWPL
jgi:hypothetical protein